MKWKNRLTNYNFWISIVSAVLLILQAFDFEYDIAYVNEIATAVLGLLVVIGIINDPTKSSSSNTENIASNSDKTTTESVVELDNNVESVIPNNEEKKTEDTNTITENNNMTEGIIPIDEKNATDTDVNKNDFEVLVEKIKTDLFTKIDELKNFYSQSNISTNVSDAVNSNIENELNSLVAGTEKIIDTEAQNSTILSSNDEVINAVENNYDETNIRNDEESKANKSAIEIQTINNIVN